MEDASMTKTTQMVISVLASDRPGIVTELTEVITDNGCNVEDSRMSVLGGEFAVIMLITGNWNNLVKLESVLESLGEKQGLTVNHKRTQSRTLTQGGIPYHVEAISLDHPGIVHKVASFFSSRNINIHDLYTTSQPAAHTGTPMFILNMTVEIPSSTHIASLRDQFMEFCDQLNLDAVIEPVKG